MIVVQDLSKRFQQGWGKNKRVVHAVQGVSWQAADGRITGLLGPNGAGKTTTLRMLAGLIAPDAGTLQVDGIDVATRPREALARMGVLSDARGLYPRLTARENIVYYSRSPSLDAPPPQPRPKCLLLLLQKFLQLKHLQPKPPPRTY